MADEPLDPFKEPIIITDGQLLEFWEQLGLPIEILDSSLLTAQLLRLIESKCSLSITDKLNLICNISSYSAEYKVNLINYLSNNQSVDIKDNEYVNEGIFYIENNSSEFPEINCINFWCAYLLISPFGSDFIERASFALILLFETHKNELWFPMYCISGIFRILFNSGIIIFDLNLNKKIIQILRYSAISLYNLGCINESLESFGITLGLLEDVCNKYNTNLDSIKYTTLIDMAGVLKHSKAYDEAITICNDALRLYQKIPSSFESDIDCLILLSDLGDIYHKRNEHIKANKFYNIFWRKLENKLSIFFSSSNRLILCSINRSILLKEMGLYKESLESLFFTWDFLQNNCSNETDIYVLQILIEKQEIYYHLGDFSNAKDCCERMLEYLNQKYHKNQAKYDEYKAICYRNYGNILQGSFELTEAFNAYLNSLNILNNQSLIGLTSYDRMRAEINMYIGMTCKKLGNRLNAIDYYQSSFLLYWNNNLSNNKELDIDRARFLMNFSIMLFDCNQLNDALYFTNEAINIYNLEPLENNPSLEIEKANLLRNKGTIISKTKDHDESMPIYIEALKIYQKNSDLNKTYITCCGCAFAYIGIGNSYFLLSNFKMSFHYYSQAWDILCDSLLKNSYELDLDRFGLSSTIAFLLKSMPDPHAWASERSQFLVSRMEMVPLPGTQDPYEWRHNEMRKYFVLFHARWLRFSLENGDFDTLPSILLALQGRKLASAMLDELDRSGLETDAPEAVRQIKQARIAIRKLDEEIRGIIGDHPYHRDGDDGLRAFMPDLRPALPPETQSKLEAKQRQRQEAFEAYLLLRAEVAQLPDYQLLQCHGDRLNGENLRQTLLPQQALALLLDLRPDDDDRKPLQGVLLLRPHASATWLPMDGLDALALQVAAFNEEMQGRGFRRSRDAAQPTDLPPLLATPDRFWQELASALSEQFWQPLLPYLADCRELTVIGHGRLHLLPLECGAPDTLTLRHYPGLVFYAQHQGLLGDRPANTESLPKTLGILSDSGDAHDPIPLAHAEAQLLKALWEHHGLKALIEGDENVSLADILATPADKMPPDVVHLACHGSGQDPHHADDLARLKLGSQTIHMPWLLAQGQQPRTVILAACLAGQTKEDMDGDPLGLVSGWFIKKTRHLTASISPLPDLWLPLFSGLLHQALLDNPQGGLPTALAVAKRRIASGDWAQDDILSALVKQHVAATLKTHYLKTASQYANPPNWQALWKQLEPELAKHGCTDAQLLPLHKYQTENPKPDLNKVAKFCGLCGQAVANALLDNPIPPPDCLGIFQFAVRCYG